MDDADLPLEERLKQLTRHAQQIVDLYAQQLRSAPDELGQFTGAALARDEAAVVRLALATQDPLIYGLGLRACITSRSSDCAALTPQRWAQLDPSNAAAWWMVGATSRDAASAVDALQHASAATHALFLDHVLLKRAIAVPGSRPEHWLPLETMTIGLDSAFASAPNAALRVACGSTTPDDPQRRSQCLAFALDSARQSPSAMGKWMATLKAEQLGARPEQLQRTSEQWKAMHVAIENWRNPERLSDSGLMSCETARQMVDFDVASAESGDVAAFERLPSSQRSTAPH